MANANFLAFKKNSNVKYNFDISKKYFSDIQIQNVG